MSRNKRASPFKRPGEPKPKFIGSPLFDRPLWQ